MKKRRDLQPNASAPANTRDSAKSPVAADTRDLIFISYRRQGGWPTARLLDTHLAAQGYRTYLDVDKPEAGPIDETLLAKISTATDVLIVLTVNCLDRCWQENDWLRLEIRHALANKKNVVPVVANDFSWPEKDLPEDIARLPIQQRLELSHEHFDDSIKQLTLRLLRGKAGEPPRSGFLLLLGLGKWRLRIEIASVCLLLLVSQGLWQKATLPIPEESRFAQVNAVHQEILRIERSRRTPDGLALANFLNKTAAFHEINGNDTSAASFYREALAIDRQNSNRTNGVAFTTAVRLALSYQRMGLIEEANKLWVEVSPPLPDTLSNLEWASAMMVGSMLMFENNFELTSSLFRRAQEYEMAGQPRAAAAALSRAIWSYQTAGGQNEPELVPELTRLARLYSEAGLPILTALAVGEAHRIENEQVRVYLSRIVRELPSTVAANENVIFNTPSHPQYKFRWNFGDGHLLYSTNVGILASHRFQDPGEYRITFSAQPAYEPRMTISAQTTLRVVDFRPASTDDEKKEGFVTGLVLVVVMSSLLPVLYLLFLRFFCWRICIHGERGRSCVRRRQRAGTIRLPLRNASGLDGFIELDFYRSDERWRCGIICTHHKQWKLVEGRNEESVIRGEDRASVPFAGRRVNRHVRIGDQEIRIWVRPG